MSISETMARIYALFDKHAPKLTIPADTSRLVSRPETVRPINHDAVVAYYKSHKGLKIVDIAKDLGISTTSVNRSLNLAGITPDRRGKKPDPKVDVAIADCLKIFGKHRRGDLKAIADKHGVNYTTMMSRLHHRLESKRKAA